MDSRPAVGLRLFLATALPGLLLLGFLALYLVFPSADYTGDGTLFADLVRSYGHDDSPGYYRLFLHPHHILYGPLATGFISALGSPPEGALDSEILRLCHLSSLLGVVALGFFFWILRRATGRPWIALAATLLLGVSHGYWAFSVNVEVQALNLLAVVLFLGALSRPPDRVGGLLLGAAHGFAVLCHLLNGLMVIPALWHLLSHRPAGRRGRVAWPLAAYASAAVLVVAPVYLLALPWVGVGSLSELLGFLRPGEAGTYLSSPASGLLPALAGLETVFLGPPRATAGVAMPWHLALRVALPVLLVGMLALRRDATLPPASSRLRRGAVVMLAAYALLWLTWDVGNPEFLVWAVPPAVALLAMALTVRAYPVVVALCVSVGMIVGAYHFQTVFRPQSNPGNNRAWVVTQFIGAFTNPDDLILISGVGDYRIGKFYLRYFARRRRLVLQWEILRQGEAPAAVQAMRSALAEGHAAGRRVLATSELFEPSTMRRLLDLHGFGIEHRDAVLRGWDRRVVARLPDGFTLWELVPGAAAGDSPLGTVPEGSPRI